MKKLSFSFFLFAQMLLSAPHEFWLQPDKFLYDRGEEISISFLNGENFNGENWNDDSTGIRSLIYYYGGVQDEIPKKLFPGKGDTLYLRQYDEGSNMLTYNSFNSYIRQEPGNFNKYLEEEGLTDVIEYRKQHNETDSAGKEFLQYCAKTIFQVGAINDETYKRKTGLPLDIIPQSHPYKHSSGAGMSFKILFKDSLLINTKVKVWHNINNETTKTELVTDENGLIEFPVNTTGRWMVTCVKTERIEKTNNPAIYIPWQSYRGSCTWGYY